MRSSSQNSGFCLVLVWLVLFFLVTCHGDETTSTTPTNSGGGESESKGQIHDQDLPYNGLNVQLSHDVADAFVEVLTDANSAINDACSTTEAPPQRRRIQKWMTSFFLSRTSPTPTCHSSSTPQSTPNHNDKEDEPQQRKEKVSKIPSLTKRSFKAFEAFRLYNKNNNKLNKEGGGGTRRVVSGSFQLLSSSAGYVADSVKVTGDTAAAMIGSSVKVMGTTVKFMGTSGLNIAKKLQPLQDDVHVDDNKTQTTTCSRKDDNNGTQEKQQQEQQPLKPPKKIQKSKYQDTRFVKNSRQAAANSFRLVGKVLEWTGESVLIAGAAAESLASSTTSVAEEAIRIVEHLAGTLSLATKANKSQNQDPLDKTTSKANSFSTAPSFFSVGRYSHLQNSTTTTEGTKADHLLNDIRTRFYNNPSLEDAIMLLELLTIESGSEISAEILGIPSMANELAAALLLCHFLAMLLLYQPNNKPSKGRKEEDDDCDLFKNDSNGKGEKSRKQIKTQKKGWKTRLLESNIGSSYPKNNAPGKYASFILMSRLIEGVLYCARMPWRCFCWSLRCVLGFVFSRRLVLLIMYAFVWIYMCRLSHQRVGAVQRRAEAVGYRNGIASITEASPPTETLLWLNHALDKLWRVKQSQQGEHQHFYPPFVTRGFRNDSGERYGGLEPYISSAIGTGLVRSLEMAKATRPTDVAYVSLFCLSLGRRPPMIRTIKLGDEIVKGEFPSQIELDLEVDALLEDLSIVFEVKLSSLSYSLLPSTKIKISNLSFSASLKAVLVLGAQFPFVSELQLSFSKQPHCDFRVAPVSTGNSSLSEVELGLLPFLTTLLNDWISDAIRSALSAFVSPGYFALDFSELLHSGRQDQPSIAPNLRRLRRETQQPIASPRTSMPSGIAITSVADHLESRHTSMQAAGQKLKQLGRRSQKKKPLLRPVTELSRLALDRHSLKEDNLLVKPVTELARLGMDRWLDSAVMRKRRKDNEEKDKQPASDDTTSSGIKPHESG